MSLQYYADGTLDRRRELFRLIALFSGKITTTDWLDNEAEVQTALAAVTSKVDALEARVNDIRRAASDLFMSL